MSEETKGFYVSFNTYIKGQVYDLLLKTVEEETYKFIESEPGQKLIKTAVSKVIEDQITRVFSWNFEKDPRADKFKKIVIDAMYKELLKQVPDAK